MKTSNETPDPSPDPINEIARIAADTPGFMDWWKEQSPELPFTTVLAAFQAGYSTGYRDGWTEHEDNLSRP